MQNKIELQDSLNLLIRLLQSMKEALFYPTASDTQKFKDLPLYAAYRRYAYLVLKFLNYLECKTHFMQVQVKKEYIIEKLLDHVVKKGLFLASDREILLAMAASAASLIGYDSEYEPVPEKFLERMRKDYEFIRKFVDKEQEMFFPTDESLRQSFSRKINGAGIVKHKYIC